MKTGYLHQDFRLFHIIDQQQKEFDFHYHDFNKIVILLSGNVTYVIEGKSYALKPWDILLINHHDVHKPIIHTNDTYDRIIIWADPNYIKNHNDETCDLTTCFQKASQKNYNLIRLEPVLQEQVKSLIQAFDVSCHTNEFGADLLNHALFLQLLIYLNRIYLSDSLIYDQTSFEYDQQIEDILLFIKENLGNKLSADLISKEFFISKHYLMHKFKAKTGYTLHTYIQNKRLSYAIELMKDGIPITKASEQCGFQDYSTFLRSFRKTFHCSPKEFLTNRPSLSTILTTNE